VIFLEDVDSVIARIIDDLVKSDPSNAFIRVKSYLGLISVYLRNIRDVKIMKKEPLELVVKYFTDCPEELGGGYTSIDIDVYMLKDQFGKLAWIRIRSRLFRLEDLDQNKISDALRELLNANYNYTEFSYDIDDDEWVGVTEDIYIPALTYDVFLEEFLAITQAVEYFIKNFARKYNVKVKCYREKDWFTT